MIIKSKRRDQAAKMGGPEKYQNTDRIFGNPNNGSKKTLKIAESQIPLKVTTLKYLMTEDWINKTTIPNLQSYRNI